jgi:DNA-binding protein HU-beta
MNKDKLIETLASKVEGINKKQAEAMIKALTDTIINELRADREVTITGFGTFSSRVRYARGGVNPQKPQERIQIPAVKVAKFKTGKRLKDSLKV